MFGWQRIYLKDVLTAGIIVLSPLLIYIHLFFNNDSKEFLIFGWHSNHCFVSEEQFVWYLMLKLIPILLFSIWFITSKFNWYFLTLIPIILFSDSLVRYTVLPDTYSMGMMLIITIISNIIYALVLFSLRKHYINKQDNNSIETISLLRALTNETRRKYDILLQIISRAKVINSKNQSINYFQNLAQLKNYFDDINKRSEKLRLSENSSKILYLIYSIFLILPFIFNVHHLVPDESLSLDFYFVHIPNFGFPSVNIFLWLFFVKTTFALGLSLWFVTCEYWWKSAILSPLLLVCYQIWEMFQDVQNIDAWGNLKAVPFLIILVFALIKISDYVKYQFKIIDLHKSIKYEFEAIIQSKADLTSLEKIKTKLDSLRNSSNSGNMYIHQLEALNKMKEELIRDLDINH